MFLLSGGFLLGVCNGQRCERTDVISSSQTSTARDKDTTLISKFLDPIIDTDFSYFLYKALDNIIISAVLLVSSDCR